MSVELVEVYRGSTVESIHSGDLVVVNSKGDILYQLGDPYKFTFWRSSAKPFQVLNLLEMGGTEAFNICGDELALMCSSHGGEESHVDLVLKVLEKIGFRVNDLDCGISRPISEEAYIKLLKESKALSVLNNACSGKHSGMLALCNLLDVDIKNYIDENHVVQQIMKEIIADVADYKASDIAIAIDGCGVPVFGLPIYNMALGYSRLTGGYNKSELRKKALKQVQDAMVQHPFYVGGTNRLDTILMEETNGKVVAKFGAESVYCVGIVDKEIGFAMKTKDGSYRALKVIIPEVLRHLDYITEEEFIAINSRLDLDVKNNRNEIIGHYKVPEGLLQK
ncbi:asparaginase [Mycoplasmatota bacterium WC44]